MSKCSLLLNIPGQQAFSDSSRVPGTSLLLGKQMRNTQRPKESSPVVRRAGGTQKTDMGVCAEVMGDRQ